MKKTSIKKLLFRPVTIAKLSDASGGRTLTWTCFTVWECITDGDCWPTAPGGTIKLTDSCKPSNCHCG